MKFCINFLFLINDPRTNTRVAPAKPTALVCVFPFVPFLNLSSLLIPVIYNKNLIYKFYNINEHYVV
jgi:hypothetical protein